MQGRYLSFRQLEAILKAHHHCVVESFPAGAAGSEEDGTESPPIYCFIRETASGETLISTIVIDYEGLPLFPHHVRSFLARLGSTLEDDILPHL